MFYAFNQEKKSGKQISSHLKYYFLALLAFKTFELLQQ